MKNRTMKLNACCLLTITTFAALQLFSRCAFATEFSKTVLQAGMHVIQAEVADDQTKRMQGLMYRKQIIDNDGMVFVFDQADRHCMWMKNTQVPLSVAFIDPQGTIVNIAQMEPFSEVSHCAQAPAKFALEMRQNWFKQKGIGEGFNIKGLATLRAH